MIDSLRRSLAAASAAALLERLGLGGRGFGLCTLHRPSNVDHPAVLELLLDALAEIAADVPVLLPLHPRTRARIARSGSGSGWRRWGGASARAEARPRRCRAAVVPRDAQAMRGAAFVLTDSGGIQEETTALGVPCVTLRENTERPVTISEGTNVLAGVSRRGILGRRWTRRAPRPRPARASRSCGTDAPASASSPRCAGRGYVRSRGAAALSAARRRGLPRKQAEPADVLARAAARRINDNAFAEAPTSTTRSSSARPTTTPASTGTASRCSTTAVRSGVNTIRSPSRSGGSATGTSTSAPACRAGASARRRAADWLVKKLEPNAHGVPVWKHEFDWEYRDLLEAGWYSALAQGQGLSLLCRMHRATGDERYLDSARAAFRSLTIPAGEGGVLSEGDDGTWLEETIVDPPTHILNGFLWALWGVRDYANASDDPAAQQLLERCTRTLKRNLGQFDCGFWSLYEQSGTKLPMLASGFYHALHISQLRVTARLLEMPELARMADRWDGYAASPSCAHRALAYKAVFKILYY